MCFLSFPKDKSENFTLFGEEITEISTDVYKMVIIL